MITAKKVLKLLEAVNSQYIWAFPNTVQKASEFQKVMSSPVTARDAESKLKGLYGDIGDLTDVIMNGQKKSPDKDIRKNIAAALSGALSTYDTDQSNRFNDPVDPQALAILKRVIANHR